MGKKSSTLLTKEEMKVVFQRLIDDTALHAKCTAYDDDSTSHDRYAARLAVYEEIYKAFKLDEV